METKTNSNKYIWGGDARICGSVIDLLHKLLNVEIQRKKKEVVIIKWWRPWVWSTHEKARKGAEGRWRMSSDLSRWTKKLVRHAWETWSRWSKLSVFKGGVCRRARRGSCAAWADLASVDNLATSRRTYDFVNLWMRQSRCAFLRDGSRWRYSLVLNVYGWQGERNLETSLTQQTNKSRKFPWLHFYGQVIDVVTQIEEDAAVPWRVNDYLSEGRAFCTKVVFVRFENHFLNCIGISCFS